MSKLVIFDIDRTIYDGSIFLDLSLQLVKKDIISAKYLTFIGFEFVTYQTGFESYDELVRDCLNYFFDEIKNLNPDVLKNELRECIFKNNHKFYDYFNLTLKSYPENDYLLVSLEPDFIVQEIARSFKIKNFLSNKFLEGDHFTKDLNLIFDKNLLLEQSIYKEQKPFAVFGDSESDLPLLQKANHKFIINPTTKLQKLNISMNLNFPYFNQNNIFEEIKRVF